MPVVVGGRKVTVAPTCGTPRTTSWKKKSYRLGHHGPTFNAYGPRNIVKAESNVATIRQHWGVNISDAIQISLHLTAQAIKQNKAKVTLPR